METTGPGHYEVTEKYYMYSNIMSAGFNGKKRKQFSIEDILLGLDRSPLPIC